MADYTITAASVLASSGAKKATGISGATITAGKLLYADASDSLKLKLASTASASAADIVGISLHGCTSGQPIVYVTEDDEFTPGATVAVGDIATNSDTAGGIRPNADNGTGDFVSAVWIATSTTQVKLLAPFKPAGAARA